ncbi:type II secretion system protein N [Pseudophaeobacter sp.]|uniref:type II secretion system protein N n=1 Tax=Pseudophaeobacter sp. TaxID=1971739 RepID=UPI003299A73F
MRLITTLLTLGALAFAALASQQLWQLLTAPEQEQAQLAPAQALAAQPEPPQRRGARQWAPLFGEKQPPRSPSPPAQQPEPQPPKPPLPPIESLGYVLKGRVQAGQATWAIVAHPSGEQLVRQGDHLREGIKVTRIDAQGLWISRQGEAPELLGFAE